jgi:hypothetical protein
LLVTFLQQPNLTDPPTYLLSATLLILAALCIVGGAALAVHACMDELYFKWFGRVLTRVLFAVRRRARARRWLRAHAAGFMSTTAEEAAIQRNLQAFAYSYLSDVISDQVFLQNDFMAQHGIQMQTLGSGAAGAGGHASAATAGDTDEAANDGAGTTGAAAAAAAGDGDGVIRSRGREPSGSSSSLLGHQPQPVSPWVAIAASLGQPSRSNNTSSTNAATAGGMTIADPPLPPELRCEVRYWSWREPATWRLCTCANLLRNWLILMLCVSGVHGPSARRGAGAVRPRRVPRLLRRHRRRLATVPLLPHPRGPAHGYLHILRCRGAANAAERKYRRQ